MKKSFFAFSLLLALPFLLFAQTPKLEVFEMAANADLIVLGKITALKPLTVEVEVKQEITGTGGGKLEVTKFKFAKNAKRWGKYAEGEEVILFLTNSGATWDIMGEYGEGEKLVLNGEVYLDNRGGGIFGKFNYIPLPSGANIYAEKLPLADFMAAVAEFRPLFKVSSVSETDPASGKVTKTFTIEQLADNAALDAYIARGDIQNQLVTDAQKAMTAK